MNFSYEFNRRWLFVALLLLLCGAPLAEAQQNKNSIGIFEAHSDVGDNPRKGSASYDAARREYRITGGGANMWGQADAFRSYGSG
jgi:hypothetical protein